ncbi:riboflavin biosynthesis protein RibD, partial [Francisella tularensis subsp. holarctica]|nr:riboflavin biosynthesis protein RibD [Francisella tularensis subsp. holarctica]
MQHASTLANSGRLTVSPTPLVGCIIVKNGAIISEGWHETVGEAHSEVHALTKEVDKANGATAYVTLEPCCHCG